MTLLAYTGMGVSSIVLTRLLEVDGESLGWEGWARQGPSIFLRILPHCAGDTSRRFVAHQATVPFAVSD
jgi:hypothetical protein